MTSHGSAPPMRSLGGSLKHFAFLWHEDFINRTPHMHPNFIEEGADLVRAEGAESDAASDTGDVFVRALPSRKGKGKGYRGAKGAQKGKSTQDPNARATWLRRDDEAEFDDEATVVWCPYQTCQKPMRGGFLQCPFCRRPFDYPDEVIPAAPVGEDPVLAAL